MTVIHELCGYDRTTDLVAVEYVIPAALIPILRTMVRSAADDDDLVLAYDISPENVRRLASMLEIAIDGDLYNYTIEASDPGEELSAARDALTAAR